MIYAVIMAGGAGTRFWPRSRKARPKQFLNLFGEKSMIQKTVERLEGFVPEDQIMVITNEGYRQLVNRQLPGIKQEFVIGEPVARNTAPCIASAAALLYEKDPDAVMVVLPADHQIEQPEEFLGVLKSAAEAARREKSLVTIGIEPNRPETGYGYIRREAAPEFKAEKREVYRVRNFTEKPELAKAREFLKSGDYLWNSGIFVWQVRSITEAFKNYLPGIYEQMETLISSKKTKPAIDQFYDKCPSISIDYGIMEKAEKVHVVPGSFGWNDVGSWKAVHELSGKDENNNATDGNNSLFLNASSNLVHTETGKFVSVVGVDNVAIVETEDSILVVNLDNAQDVKEITDKLKNSDDLKGYL